MTAIRSCAYAGLMLAAGAASAADHPLSRFFPGKDTCYSRVYSPQHLASHPKQRVRNIQIVHPFLPANGLEGVDFRMALSFQLKNSRESHGPISVYCNGDPDGTASCEVEADGGRFRLGAGANDTLVITIERLKLEGAPEFSKGGDDRVFVLGKAPMKACPSNVFEE